MKRETLIVLQHPVGIKEGIHYPFMIRNTILFQLAEVIEIQVHHVDRSLEFFLLCFPLNTRQGRYINRQNRNSMK
jgi:hypothetical protein